MEAFRNIIVIGASAGGFQAIGQLTSQIPGTINAPVFVVLHLASNSNVENIVALYQRHSSLNCREAKNGTIVYPGYLYVAPADHHMIVKDNIVFTNKGARENKYRPSIDVLFRSAAVHYGPRVIGVILTGMLDDGTSGMYAIKKCGGTCIVQDPEDAQYDSMPLSVMNQIQVDYKVPLNMIASVLDDVMQKPLPEAVPVPKELIIENEITEQMMTSIDNLKEIGEKSDFTCPECGGGLWAVRNDPTHRYRCHTGHVYTENLLLNSQNYNLEESVLISIRMMEEKRNLLRVMASHSEQSGDVIRASESRERALDMEKHVDGLKFILAKLTEERSV